ncbi:hypothetical protein HA402_011949, partial [Bradysia odoriphaga]
SSDSTPFEYVIYMTSLMYNFFDIYMVAYFGNEIKLESSKLSYSLFGSNWCDQSHTSKKCICILMEVLKRPEQLTIGIYLLDLEIFTNNWHNDSVI